MAAIVMEAVSMNGVRIPRILLLGTVFLCGMCPKPAAGGNLVPQTETALLHRQWEEVRDRLLADDSKAADPVSRLLMAHACLATNRNNEATVLFLSLLTAEATESCHSWAKDFAAEHADSAVAHYLLGDSLARLGQSKTAIQSLDAAVRIDPQFVLARSARGVVRAMSGDLDGAVIDLDEAAELKPDLADAHANLGTVWVGQNAAQGAIAEFDKALERDPGFALAYNGRGCARFGNGDYDAAIEDLEKAFDLCPVLLPAGANEALVLAALYAETAPEQGDSRPGTSLTTRADFRDVDYSRFRTENEFESFYRSVEPLIAQNRTEALRVLIDQQSKVRTALAGTTLEINRHTTDIARAGHQMRASQLVNSFLGLSPGVESLLPGRLEGWRQVLEMSRRGLEITEEVLPENAEKILAGAVSRSLHAPPIALLRASTYLLLEKPAENRAYGRRTELGVLQGQATILQRFDYDLSTHVASVLALGNGAAQGLEGVDPFRTSAIKPVPVGRQPIPEYKIPAASPLTQFGILPAAIGTDIAPRGKTPVVVVNGIADFARLGTMLREFEARGIRTLPTPSGMDRQFWGQTVGADRIVNITSEPFTPARSYSVPGPSMSITSKPGGVSTEGIAHSHVDRGNWPVMTTFVLAYPGTTEQRDD